MNFEEMACALCNGQGEVSNPDNANPEVAVSDWLPPVGCPRCGCTGKDPNPGDAEVWEGDYV